MTEKMEGYLRNKFHIGSHIMKRYIEPNGKVPLEELYVQYGDKYNLKRGEDFIFWLREVKLKDKDKWEVVEKDEVEEVKVKKSNSTQEESEDDTTLNKPIKQLTVEDIVELSVRKARLAMPKISNVKLLKVAFKEASQRPNKKYICDILNKRILELADLGIS